MTFAALFAFLKANQTLIFSIWILLEQYLASNDKIKSNSTSQLVINLIHTLLSNGNNAGK